MQVFTRYSCARCPGYLAADVEEPELELLVDPVFFLGA